MGPLHGFSGGESTCHAGDRGLDPQARKIPRAWEQLSPGVSRRPACRSPCLQPEKPPHGDTCALQGERRESRSHETQHS